MEPPSSNLSQIGLGPWRQHDTVVERARYCTTLQYGLAARTLGTQKMMLLRTLPLDVLSHPPATLQQPSSRPPATLQPPFQPPSSHPWPPRLNRMFFLFTRDLVRMIQRYSSAGTPWLRLVHFIPCVYKITLRVACDKEVQVGCLGRGWGLGVAERIAIRWVRS